MPESALNVALLVAVVVVAGYYLREQYKRDRKYFGDLTARPQAVARHEEPALSDEEVDAQYAAVQRALARFPLPSVRIRALPGKATHPWQSKFGGIPYWPRHETYPVTPKGEPLYMVAQLNLAEMPPLPGYPNSGLLQFFIADDDVMGLKFGNAGEETIRMNSDGSGSRVIYHREITEDAAALATDLPHCGQAESMPLGDEYALAFEYEDQLPLHTDHRFDAALAGLSAISDDVMERLWENSEQTQSRFGGYAYFTQDDVRHGTAPGDWLLLFQMDTDDEEGVEIMWGDCGVGNWFIHRDDLARQDFSRAWYNWDCC